MVLHDLSITFILTEVLKHSRKDKPLDKFEFRSYADKKSCIISYVREYLTRRDNHVGLNMDQLIIALKKLFKGASINPFITKVKPYNFLSKNCHIFLTKA